MIAALQTEPIYWFGVAPILILLGSALVLLVAGSLTRTWPKGLYALVTACGAGAAGAIAMTQWDDITDASVAGPGSGSRFILSGTFRLDYFTLFVTIGVCAALLLVTLVADDYLRREGLDGPEVYALLSMASLGAIVMAAANDFIVLFLGLETLSIALYVLAASHRRRIESQESGIKYFVLGGFASAFFLYGVALVYGASGSTNFSEIRAEWSANVLTEPVLALAGVALLLVGLGFKVAAVPFHFWTPDVYQGAPTPVTAFMASVAKAAAFAAMLRVVWAVGNLRDDFRPVIWVLAAVTLVGGAVMAVVQTNVKRMLAFSSISHAGFLLVGVEAAAHNAGEAGYSEGVSSTLLYLFLYGVLVVGTFAVVTLVGRTGDGATGLAAFRGLGRSRPALALGFTVLLLAQAGVPLTSGFVAKFGVIKSAVEEKSYAIAIIAMVSAVIAAFLYLRIMISMWVAEPQAGDDARETVRTPVSTSIAVAASVGFTLLVGFFPGWLIDATRVITAL